MTQKQNKGLRDVPRSRIPAREYLDRWEEIFGKKHPNGNEKLEEKK